MASAPAAADTAWAVLLSSCRTSVTVWCRRGRGRAVPASGLDRSRPSPIANDRADRTTSHRPEILGLVCKWGDDVGVGDGGRPLPQVRRLQPEREQVADGQRRCLTGEQQSAGSHLGNQFGAALLRLLRRPVEL